MEEVASAPEPVTVADLTAFAATFADLPANGVMKGAWEWPDGSSTPPL
jgi:hypothetical protein